MLIRGGRSTDVNTTFLLWLRGGGVVSPSQSGRGLQISTKWAAIIFCAFYIASSLAIGGLYGWPYNSLSGNASDEGLSSWANAKCASLQLPCIHAAAAQLVREGHCIFNPAARYRAQRRRRIPPQPNRNIEQAEKRSWFDLRKALAHDSLWLCQHAEAIAMLPGWENSAGATAERAVRLRLGLVVIDMEDMLE